MNDRMPVFFRPEHLTAAYALVTQLEKGDIAPPAEPTKSFKLSIPPDSALQAFVWSPDKIQQLWKDSQPRLRLVLRFLAEHPGYAFTGKQLAQLAGHSLGNASFAGMVGCLIKRSRNRYKVKVPPFRSYWASTRQRHEYSMDATHAALVMALPFVAPEWWNKNEERAGVTVQQLALI